MPNKWGLFHHDPCTVTSSVDLSAPIWNECSCGWSTLPVERRYLQAVMDAERHHLDEVRAAVNAWRAERTAAGVGGA